VTEDLRALLRADLSGERPPPLGDLVGAAIRDGRRIRRKQRIGRIGAGLLAIAAAVTAFVLLGDGGVAGRRYPPTEAAGVLSPPSVPPAVPGPPNTAEARTLTIRGGTTRAGGSREKATSAAMLHLLTQLLPPGRTTHLGVAAGDDLQVQLYLDDGSGPGMVRVSVGKNGPISDEPPRGRTVSMTIRHMPDNCLQGTVVDAAWPDGTLVQVFVASCLDPAGPPTLPALTVEQAVRVAADPRWGVTMDTALVAAGAKQFPILPVLG
jgi:hypothetical protein